MRLVLLCISLVCGSAFPASAQQLKEITNSIGMKLVLIHRGSFTMGAPRTEAGSSPNEMQHEVKISNSFYLGAFEVTQNEYEKVMRDNPSTFKGADNPVETVSWNDANSFCTKLSALPEERAARREYRLPTEAEWEYACRATSNAAFCFGDSADLLEEYGWFIANSGRNTHPVGEKKANRWGLFDMHGNVWEWCQDWEEQYSSGSLTDPQGPSKGSTRVVRGGSWKTAEVYCRSASRSRYNPSPSSSYGGFRVAMSLQVMQPESASSK